MKATVAHILVSLGFIFFGIAGLLNGETNFKEILSDLKFLWGPGRDSNLYYGLSFVDD